MADVSSLTTKMDSILITGGAGFIGSSLADRLIDRGFRVIVVDNFNDYYDPSIKECNISSHIGNNNYKLYRADIEDISSLQEIFSTTKIDIVVHLAARAGVRPSLLDPLAYMKTNVLGTVNILECMKTFGVKKMVFASSSSVYGNCDSELFSENLKVTEPISPYAASKSACEQIIYTYTHLYDIKAVCLRFFTVYGPRQRPDLAISKFTRLIMQNKPLELYGDGSTVRDYTYIEDIVDGVYSAIKYDKTPYEIINLGGGEPVSLINMVKTLEKALGLQAKICRKPMQPGDVHKTACDLKKAASLLGYSPKVSFEAGIHQYIDWINTTH